MLKKTALLALFVFFGLRGACHAGLEGAGEALEALGIRDMLPQAVIDFDRVADYLHWEQLTVSLRADMASITDLLGKKVLIDAVIYKKGLAALRIDIKGGLQVREGGKSLSLANCYLLEFPRKDKALVVFPRKKGFMELDPEKIGEMLGDMIEKKNKKKSVVLKKERLGRESIDGRLCEKMHIVMLTEKGLKNDITAWLARDLGGFPVKTIVNFELPRGRAGTSSIAFRNITKGVQESALFELPEGYKKYDNLVELATEGKAGSRLGKPGSRDKPFQRRRH